jgi:hypothetical protein
MARRDEESDWAGLLQLFTLLIAVAICILLWRDARTEAANRAFILTATVIAAVPLFYRASRLGLLALALAVAGLGTGAYRVGGLAFAVPAVLIAFTSLIGTSAQQSPRGRRVARVVLVVAVLLSAASLFDPGGAMFVVLPVMIPIGIWAALAGRTDSA